jgi:hypothetical protein
MREAYAANCFGEAQPLNGGTDFGMGCNQIDCGLDLAPKAIAETGASAFVPMNGFAKFRFRGGVGANRFAHR